jgi:SAM-dependent methyltransferase
MTELTAPISQAQDRAQTRRVREWQRLYDWVYGDLNPDSHPDGDFVGWRSTYTGEAYATAEMAEWRQATLDRIASLRPRRVLELGVGSGLLLTGLLPDTEEYVGTDLSRTAVQRLAARAATDPAFAGRTRFEERPADDFTGLPAGHFDVVILNSVSQYFPGLDYLRRVVDGALETLRPGGAMFVGDVRDLRLHRAFRTGVHVSEIEASADSPAARRLIDESVAAERELLVHPEFFTSLPGVEAVDVRVKRARFRNEMSAHRYDVALFLAGAPVLPAKAPTLLQWTGVEALKTAAHCLSEGSSLIITGVPNARVFHEVSARRLLDSSAVPADVVRMLRQIDSPVVPDLERFFELGDRFGFETVVSWGRADVPDSLDISFLRPVPGYSYAASPVGSGTVELANNPLGHEQK